MKRETKRNFAKNLIAVSAVLLLVSAGTLLWQQYRNSREEQAYQELKETVAVTGTEEERETETVPETAETETETETEEYCSPVDFDALTEINEETVGWIRIPDTNIDYPIVQTDNNDTYLHTGFQGEKSQAGTIFLDCDSEADFSGWNNILYGHHMKNGSMFKHLIQFKDEDFFRNHRYFVIYTPERAIYLKTMACFYGPAEGSARRTAFQSQEAFEHFVKERVEHCAYAEYPEEAFSSVFTLITCSYELENARTYLYASEVPDEELAEAMEAVGE